MPPKIVQRIDFVLSLKQVLQMCITEEDTNGIMLTLGITDKAEIIFTSEGVCWDGKTMRSTSGPVGPCPIPPDCPKNVDCINNLNQIMPSSDKAGEFIDVTKANDFLNK